MADKPTTQKSQPRKKDVEPIDIPIPTRSQVFGDLAKTAQPQKPTRRRRDQDKP